MAVAAVRPEVLRSIPENLADLSGGERRVSLEEQGCHPAHLGCGNRGACGELILPCVLEVSIPAFRSLASRSVLTLGFA